jgi:hypothetical protein
MENLKKKKGQINVDTISLNCQSQWNWGIDFIKNVSRWLALATKQEHHLVSDNPANSCR